MNTEIRLAATHSAVNTLLATVAYLRTANDPALIGYAVALLRRVNATLDPDYTRRPDTRERWKIRHDIQQRGLDLAIKKLDAWEASPTSTLADLPDLVRDVYQSAVNVGIDSVLPEFADLCLREAI